MSSQRSIPTEDRISTLPDSVISHILSFLPTKQSAATSILSKRWNPLWLTLLALDFDEQNFANFGTFRHFVYSVMLLRNITLPIRSFRLKCGNTSDFNPHDVNRFIEAVVQRGIQNLNLEMLCYRSGFKLPQCVLTCNSLTVLKLKRLTIQHFSKVNFPLLKTLHLNRIRFFSLHPSFLKRFLCGCPVLEDLHIQYVLLLDYECGEFNGLLKLVKANIINSTYSNWNFLFSWVRNAKFLCNRPYGCQVPAFLNLTNLKIIFGSTTNDWLGKWKWMTEVLENCPKLQNLTIHEDSSGRHEIGNDDWVDPSIVPKCLSSELRTCSLIGYEGMKCEFQFVEYILKNAKALHTMKISASDVDLSIKHQMLMKLSLCPRGSTTCKLSFV
ncbi:FBD-associated F-box protein At4g10400-like [Trifolium pratense]|uniref:FBD-associated F-box protein At4g10400-like n=1 Tax=Trifolium pratense TaxID=57577 RepID=UPI001E69745D|nr:FBD-associated F-box protein At4g10400-like [Trifolium pratense]